MQFFKKLLKKKDVEPIVQEFSNEPVLEEFIDNDGKIRFAKELVSIHKLSPIELFLVKNILKKYCKEKCKNSFNNCKPVIKQHPDCKQIYQVMMLYSISTQDYELINKEIKKNIKAMFGDFRLIFYAQDLEEKKIKNKELLLEKRIKEYLL